MCDTMVFFYNQFNPSKERSFLAKNSDRNPGEAQIVYQVLNPEEDFNLNPYLEAKAKYIDKPFRRLVEVFEKFKNPYRAIISRPVWIWGAEMGVNEAGLSIGNEAVFSKTGVSDDGLLGMDILRLALHNNRTAREAVDFIISLIIEYNQGGDGGYSSSLKYHNSFLIKDKQEAYVLETAGKHWAWKKVSAFATISNSYTIRNDYDATDKKTGCDFKSEYENRVFSFVTRGDRRQKYSADFLANRRIDLPGLMDLLRYHNKSDGRIKRGMGSICMHPGPLTRTETTSSMIVDYYRGKTVIWFTGSPNPCVSLFKPLVFELEKDFLVEPLKAIEYFSELRKLAQRLTANYDLFLKRIKPLRDELERNFIEKVYGNIKKIDEGNFDEQNLISVFLDCFELERDYIKEVYKLLGD